MEPTRPDGSEKPEAEKTETSPATESRLSTKGDSAGSTAPSAARSSSKKRLWAILGTVAFVIFLAGVIFWGSALSSPDSGDDVTQIESNLTPEEESAELYRQAVAKLQSGETTEAATLLKKAVALDPDNAAAADALARISQQRDPGTDDPADDPADDPGDDPADDPGDDPGDDPDPDAGFNDPVDDLTVLLPSQADGYELGTPASLGSDATVPADPVEGGPVVEVRRVLYTVHDFGTPEDAQSFVDNVTPSAFPENQSDVTVHGAAGYFGTDGTRFASVSFARGRYAFEVIVTSNGGAPGALLDISVDAASAFPESL